MRRTAWGFFAAAIGIGALGNVARAQQNYIRPLPFPFHHLFSVVANSDNQVSDQGMASRLNLDFGLPLAGSLQVNNDNASKPTPTLFNGDITLNRADSAAAGLPMFADLLRRWHRGEIDQVNGWHTDTVYDLRNKLEPAVRLAASLTSLKLNPGPESARSLRYTNLRLLLNGTPPPDMTIVAIDDRGKSAVADLFAVAQGRSVQYRADSSFWVEVIFDQRSAAKTRGTQIDPEFRLGGLSEVRLFSSICGEKEGCAASVLQIERGTFSRQTVFQQVPWLEAWNIRPSIYTSSTGLSPTDALWSPNAPELSLSGPDQSPVVAPASRDLIDQPSSFAYILDQLHQIGTDFIGTHKSPQRTFCAEPRRSLPIVAGSFYDPDSVAAADVSAFASVVDVAGSSARRPAQKQSQGAAPERPSANQIKFTLPVLATMAVDESEKKSKPLDCIYRVSLSDFDIAQTRNDTVASPDAKAIASLANRYYNFDGQVREAQRIWVPPASVAARYRLLIENIASHIKITGNQLVIVPWKDPTTKRTIPEPLTGTRDLNGLTVYVPDPDSATVQIGDVPVETLMRNPPDSTGRRSITIVDDHVPTMILGAMPMSALGPIATAGAAFYDAPWQLPKINNSNMALSLQIPDGGDGWVSVKARELFLYNTTHLKLRYRHVGSAPFTGNLFVELVLEDGGRVTISEGRANDPPLGAGSGWWIPEARTDDVVIRTLATTSLTFRPGRTRSSSLIVRPPLPIGRVAAVRFGLKGASRGESVEILELSALRSSGNGAAPDGSLLLSGRVTHGSAAAKAVVRARTVSGKTLVSETGDDGLYYFFGMAKGDPVYVAAGSSGNPLCAPNSAPIAPMRSDMVQLDVDLDSCISPPTAVWSDVLRMRQPR